mgnify:CR=1 FL=1|tara:strand:- start:419 stop:589 length:171 start_codon:yes stop_codon:yes gene_type:complete
MLKEKKLMLESISKVLDLDGGLDLLKDETFMELAELKIELAGEVIKHVTIKKEGKE